MAEKQYDQVESDGNCQETVSDSVFSTSTIQQIIADFKSKLERNQILLKGQLTFTVGASAVNVIFHSKENDIPIQHPASQHQLEVSPEIYKHFSLETKICPSKTCFETQNSQDSTMLKCCPLINGPQTPLPISNINFRDPMFFMSHTSNFFKCTPIDGITELAKTPGQYKNSEEVTSNLSISEPQNVIHTPVSSAMLPPSKFFAEQEQKDFVQVDDLLSSSGYILPPFSKILPKSCTPLQHDPESSRHRLFKTDNLTMDSEIFCSDNSASINEPGSKYEYSKQELVFQELRDHMNTEQIDDSCSGTNLTNLDIMTANSFLNKKIKHLSKPSVHKSNGHDKKTHIHCSSYNKDVMVNSSQAVEGKASVTNIVRQKSKDSESCDDDKQIGLNGNSSDKKINDITDFETLKKRNISLNELGKLNHGELVSILTDILQNIFPGDASKNTIQLQDENNMQALDGQIPEKFTSLQKKEIVKSPLFANLKEEINVICTKVSEEQKNTSRKGTNPTKIKTLYQTLEKNYSQNNLPMSTFSTQNPEVTKKNESFKMLLRGKRKLGNTVSKVSRSTNDKEKGCAVIKPLKKRAIQHNHETVENENGPTSGSKDMCLVKDQAMNVVNETESQINENVSKHKRKLNNTQESYACSECSKTFSTKVLFRRHLRSHSNGYQCDICGKTLKTKDSLYHHQRGLHTKDKPYKCKQCGATFNFHHSYKLHVQRHKGERPHKCQTCHKTYLTSNHLKVHTEAAHGVGSIICHICGKAFSYSCSLKQHLQKHSGERPYPCEKCNKSFPSKQSLRAHSLSHIVVKNFTCELCSKSYKSEHAKNAHMKRHGKQQLQFICEICGKAFHFKSSLQVHMNIHSKARPYACLICGKAFKSKASLYTHKYVHRESQSFLCTLCGKAFKTKNCCAAHMKRHENDATYSCSQCGSTFPDKGGLSKHVKTIHVPKKHFMCKICGKKGTRGDNMRTHVKSHRNEVTETANPVDFIVEENIPTSHSAQGFVNIRPRLRGPKQRGSRRLYTKNMIDDSKNINEQQYQNVQTKTGAVDADNICKSELPALSTLQPSLLNLPLMEQAHYNTHLSYITDDAFMQDISANQISGLPSGNHHSSNQDIELYTHDQTKASYYYMPQHSELTISDNNPTVCYGPMASLLSAINSSSEQDNVVSDSVYQIPLTSLHAVSRQENSLSISSIYSDTEQGNVSKHQQMLNSENPMIRSIYLDVQPHADPNMHERHDVDF